MQQCPEVMNRLRIQLAKLTVIRLRTAQIGSSSGYTHYREAVTHCEHLALIKVLRALYLGALPSEIASAATAPRIINSTKIIAVPNPSPAFTTAGPGQ